MHVYLYCCIDMHYYFLLLLDKIKEAALDGVAPEDEKKEKFNEIQHVY
jgi:hypothetical protein